MKGKELQILWIFHFYYDECFYVYIIDDSFTILFLEIGRVKRTDEWKKELQILRIFLFLLTRTNVLIHC